MKATALHLFLLVLFFQLLVLPDSCHATEINYMRDFIRSRRFNLLPRYDESLSVEEVDNPQSQVYIGPQDGLMEADKISALPGQPEGVNFNQYAGYVTVDPKNGRALFYYFVESPYESSTKPLVLWLNGGPGCSSLGYGAMGELGPFRVNSDNKTLSINPYAWNNVANVIFLESPAGVGFSYSNTSLDYYTGDQKTAKDSYIFLLNWLERFPQYKTRDFYITGESYAGHYVPQLAYTIVSKNTNQNNINLKGISIGNAYIDYLTVATGSDDYAWSHALISDESYKGIKKYCNYKDVNVTKPCIHFLEKSYNETGVFDYYNIYAPLCHQSTRYSPACSLKGLDPCSDNYVASYLNDAMVQRAIHAKATKWEGCGGIKRWSDSPHSVLPTIKHLIASGLRVWLYSGDVDYVIPVTATRYAINTLNLPVVIDWRPWCTSNEVGGYVEGYKGLVFTTVRGSGHMVPRDEAERALTMISSFLQAKLPPSCQEN
ncbi:hypothetical protein K2173_007320 [Erythroxylum novogranatense]|uniref:Carboxypeptidase n=1 Tax=Erythroxylum novogranatense TaxID=1862640 RepID=A0AAV8T702_9ROSI|nr:hypothetical protein K2173_007320 [Erythroxylum novogranatense]